MKKISFNTKYLKTGGYSVLVSLIAIAIIIFVNLFANKLPTEWTQIDTSDGDILSIGEETEKLVSGITEEVTVYYVVQHGSEHVHISAMLDKYKALSDKIKVEQIDPALNPSFLTGDRSGVQEGSLIVESAKRSKIINQIEIFYPGFTSYEELNMYYQYTGQQPTMVFDMENLMTTAINYVTTDNLPVIYALTGHGENTLSDSYKNYLDVESMILNELNLATAEAVPEDCDCIFVNAPRNDISADEATLLLDYLKKGGRLMYVSDYINTVDKKHTNMQTVLDYYGVAPVEGVIYEGDSDYHHRSKATWLYAQFGSHEIVNVFTENRYGMLLDGCQGIVKSDNVRDTVEITPLISTTDKAFSRVGSSNTSWTKGEGDIEGPFDYAVAISDTNDDGSESKVVWINTPDFLEENSDIYGTFRLLFVNSFAWMCEIEETVAIPSKALDGGMLNIANAQSVILTVVFAIAIPAVAIITGFVVRYRRRSK